MGLFIHRFLFMSQTQSLLLESLNIWKNKFVANQLIYLALLWRDISQD